VFGSKFVLRDIDLEIVDGEFLTIFGPNGAGKTTLLKIMSTLISPTRGTVVVDGLDIHKNPQEIRSKIGVISHETYLYGELTARENLRFYGKMYGTDHLEERIKEVIEEVGLRHRQNDRVSTFSRGMKQRLSIARAIIHNPPILLLDEPYTGLDQQAAATFDRILEGLESRIRIMVSHDLERGTARCSRALILDHGSIVHEIPPRELRDLERCRHLYQKYTETRT